MSGILTTAETGRGRLVALVVVAAMGCSTSGAKSAPGGGGMGGSQDVPEGVGAGSAGGSGDQGGGPGPASAGMGGTPDGGAGAGGMGGGIGGGGGLSAGGSTGGCGTDRLTAPEATNLYRGYAFAVQPGLNPTTVFEARELDVAGLWEGLNAQLFYVSGKAEDGGFFRDCTILTHACQVFVPAGECSQAVTALASGVVANGAFYFSWGFGSGVFRSRIGKLAPNGVQFTRIVSPSYVNANSGGPPLVLRVSGADILVHRASSQVFNEPSTSAQVGKVKDLGDALTIVDDSGQPIAETLPP